MNLVLDFKIGLWNAWIPIVPFVLMNYATAPLDAPATHGMYQISRHPMYVAFLIIVTGIGIMSVSWVFLAFCAPCMILNHYTILAEERFCLEKYGDSYRKESAQVSGAIHQ